MVRHDVPRGDPDFGKLFICDCQRLATITKFQELSGLSDVEQKLALSKFITKNRPGTANMINVLRGFINEPSNIVTLWGYLGNGKTTAVMATVNELNTKLIECRYITTSRLISYIQEAYDNSGSIQDGSAYDRFYRYAELPVLVLDEFDKVRLTPWVEEKLRELIDKRYLLALDKKAGTIIVLNRNPNTLLPDIYSRLADRRNTIINNSDKDIRPYLER